MVFLPKLRHDRVGYYSNGELSWLVSMSIIWLTCNGWAIDLYMAGGIAGVTIALS
jgi:hypothetical protein